MESHTLLLYNCYAFCYVFTVTAVYTPSLKYIDIYAQTAFEPGGVKITHILIYNHTNMSIKLINPGKQTKCYLQIYVVVVTHYIFTKIRVSSTSWTIKDENPNFDFILLK